VIPTHNRRDAVLLALHSVVAQTRPVDEICVIDDGSTDGSAAAIHAAFPHITVIEQPNRGVSAARNRGIAATSGEWVAFLDSDDAWQPRKIERQLAVLAEQPGARLCHTDEIWIRNGRRVNPRLRHAKGGGWIYRNCLELCVISPSAALVRRDVFAEIGAFDESLPVCEDYDMWLRLCSQEPVAYVDEPLVIKTGGHADQLSLREWGMDRFRILALERMLASGRLTDADRDATIDVLRRKIGVYMAGARKRGKRAEVEEYTRRLEQLAGLPGSMSIPRDSDTAVT
jgi:glycosyltransferase involved in cell wall biosynthesis